MAASATRCLGLAPPNTAAAAAGVAAASTILGSASRVRRRPYHDVAVSRSCPDLFFLNSAPVICSRRSRCPSLHTHNYHAVLYTDPSPRHDKNQSSKIDRVNLGRTLRILQDRMPTLLQSPLPQDLLAPNICLHLFPSTHPHLPTVSGRVAYTAALYTSPIAWNRIPLIGNLRVDVLSERMSRDGNLSFSPRRAGAIPEQLVVRWRTTSRKDLGVAGGQAEVKERASEEREDDFTGLYVFQFDYGGRILSHTIEHAQTGDGWERGVGARVVGLTDWLLGGLKGIEGGPAGAS